MTQRDPEEILPEGRGCEECGATDNGVHVEAWETLDQVLCDDCGTAALEDRAA